jgi:hypothetical protein
LRHPRRLPVWAASSACEGDASQQLVTQGQCGSEAREATISVSADLDRKCRNVKERACRKGAASTKPSADVMTPKREEALPEGSASTQCETGGDLLSQGESAQVPSVTAAIDCCVRNDDQKIRKSRPEGRLNSNAKPAATYSPRANPPKYHRRNWT